MKLVTLEHLRITNAAQRPDWGYLAVSVGVLLALWLATPLLRALASYGW